MLLPLALSLSLLAPAVAQEPRYGAVWGVVRSSEDGAPLAFADVEVAGSGGTLVAVTDSLGQWIIENVPAGLHSFLFRHLNHQPHRLEFRVHADRTIYLEIELKFRPVNLPKIDVSSRGLSGLRVDTLPVSVESLSNATERARMESSPGVVELGLGDAAREVPGHEPPDPSDMLLVRGSSAELKMIYLNGAPVVAPFHIAGLIQALDTDLLRSATLYLGGAPSRLNGGLSYIMDIETRAGRGDAPLMAMGFDMVAAKMTSEGALGPNGSFLIGARAVHGWGTPFLDRPFPYAYGDVLGRIDLAVGDSGRLSVSGFWNREHLRLDYSDGPDQVAGWGNEAGSFRYRGVVSRTEIGLTAALGTFETELPLGGENPLLTSGRSRRARVAADLARTMGSVRLLGGASYERARVEQRVRLFSDAATLGDERSGGAGEVAGGYAEIVIVPARRLELRGGLRADVYSVDPDVRISPRLALSLLITEGSVLTLAGGRYGQYVLTPVVLFGGGSEPETGDAFEVASASHAMVSLDQRLGDGLALGLEGFYKAFDGLPEESGESADASGVEVWVRRTERTITGWLGYSLAWVWTNRPDRFTTTRISAGRHLVSAGLRGPFMRSGRFEVRVAYGAGLPYTAIPEPDVTTPVFTVAGQGAVANLAAAEPVPPPPTEPSDPYLRVDAQLSHTWSGRWNDVAFQFTPYIKVLNALDRRDALFYHFDHSGNTPEPRPLAPLPILPVVGLEWKF